MADKLTARHSPLGLDICVFIPPSSMGIVCACSAYDEPETMQRVIRAGHDVDERIGAEPCQICGFTLYTFSLEEIRCWF